MAISNALNMTQTGQIAGSGSGAWSGSTLTQHYVAVAGASNTLVAVTPGAAGLVLTSNGTSADPSFQAAGASSGIIASAIFDSSANISYSTNVTSISKSTSGGLDRYTITMTTPAASANYNVIVGGYIAIASRYGYSNTGWTPTSSSVLEVSAATGTYTGFNVSIIGG